MYKQEWEDAGIMVALLMRASHCRAVGRHCYIDYKELRRAARFAA